MMNVKSIFRPILLKLLKLTEEKKPILEKRKDELHFFQAHIPIWLWIFIDYVVIFIVFSFRFNFEAAKLVSILLFESFIFLFLFLYLKYYFGSYFKREVIGLISVLFIVLIIINEIIQRNPHLSLYLTPFASVGILLYLLTNSRVSIVCIFAISLILSIFEGLNFDLFIFGFAGGVTSIFVLRNVRSRDEILKAGLYVIGINIITILSLFLIKRGVFFQLGTDLIWAIGNGLFSVILALGLLPFLEKIFFLTSDIKLLELADFNQPLLKRVIIEAPGTYHHSLMVGNLAEAAANLIGANSLLARVASYYHDIGKLFKPEYFIENQQSTFKSKHEDLSPNMSSLILISHVKEGINLAKKYKLPRPIIDIIEQHHGTSLIYYFYQKALEEYKTSHVEESKYRYPGPKPKTKEAAIVMLADIVEAASRTLEAPSYERISELVNKVINNKFIDEQLNDCDLTLLDLRKIAQSFIHTLVSTHHGRIEYPEESEK